MHAAKPANHRSSTENLFWMVLENSKDSSEVYRRLLEQLLNRSFPKAFGTATWQNTSIAASYHSQLTVDLEIAIIKLA